MDIKIEKRLAIQSSPLNANEFAAYMGGGDDPEPKKSTYKFKDPTYPKPIKNTHPDYIVYKEQLDKLKANAQLIQNSSASIEPIYATSQKQRDNTKIQKIINVTKLPQQIAAKSVASPYDEGQKIGAQIAETTGGQIVILGENHNETAQADALVGVVSALKAKGDTRQIIYIDELSKNDCTNDSYTQWNKTEPSKRKVGTLGETLCGSTCVEEYELRYNGRVLKEPRFFRSSTMARTLNELSRLAPSMLAFNVDVNHDSESLPDIDRDTAIAMNIKKLREQYPDAIIIGSFGNSHATETRQDKPNTPNNINTYYTNLNDPMAEQLALLYGHAKVHTIRIVPKAYHLNLDCNGNPVHTNTGQFDYVITVEPQNQKRPWNGGEWEKEK